MAIREEMTPEDVQLVSHYMQGVRDARCTPNKVAERGVEFTDELIYMTRPELPKLFRMALVNVIVLDALKIVGLEAKVEKKEK